MNPIIRNLINITRRFKLAFALNILGLSVAFAAFIIIMIQLSYDYSFDRCHMDHENPDSDNGKRKQSLTSISLMSNNLVLQQCN